MKDNDSKDREIGRRHLLEAVGEIADDRGPSRFVVRRGTFCVHARVEVCSEQREVACATCGAKLDPFDVLHGFATKERWLGYSDSERREVEKRIALMKAEERRIKARLSTAKRRAPAEQGELEALRRVEGAVRNASYFTQPKPLREAVANLDRVRTEAKRESEGRDG